jgi:hypothetical protein
MFRTCIETKKDGAQCGSPALRNNLRCHWHSRRHVTRVLNSRTYKDSVLSSEGRLQTINHLLHALLNGQIDSKTVSSALYGVRIATELSQDQDFGSKPLPFNIFPGFPDLT